MPSSIAARSAGESPGADGVPENSALCALSDPFPTRAGPRPLRIVICAVTEGLPASLASTA